MRCGSLTHSGVVESSGESQWELLSLFDNTQRRSQQRMIEKMKYFPEYLQQSTDDIEMTRIKKQRKAQEGQRKNGKELCCWRNHKQKKK